MVQTAQGCRNFSSFVSKNRLWWLLFIAVLGIAADQSSKYWAQNTLAVKIEVPVNGDAGEENSKMEARFFSSETKVLIPSAFDLVYKENPAAAFSITSSLPEWFRRPFLIIVSALATLFFLIWYFRIKEADALLLSSFCLIMAGAVGNFIDRVRFGYVVDFLDVYAGFLGYPNAHWPTFNIADSLIVAGAIGVVIRTLWPCRKTL